MGNKNMSAKDKAFEKERVKFRQQIRSLEYDIKQKDIEIKALKESSSIKDDQIIQLKSQIIELSKLIGCSTEEIESAAQLNKTMKNMKSMFDIFNNHY